MTQELKPCPFCGSEAELNITRKHCHCSTGKCWLNDFHVPIDFWNTRPREERYRKALEEIANYNYAL